MRNAAQLLGLLFVATSSFACAKELPPPVPPLPVAPKNVEARTTEPRPGTTRVLLEANGERAVVKDVVEEVKASAVAYDGRASAFVDTEASSKTPVCVAPCFADLTPGLHVLEFTSDVDPTRTSTANVQVNDSPKIVRHAMGRKKPTGWGATILGETFLIGGGAIAFTGLTMASTDAGKDASPGLIIGGLAAVALGIPLMLKGASEHQPGSTTEIAAR